MPLGSDLTIDPQRERAYRRGYSHGVLGIVASLEAHLPQEIAEKLRRWSTNELFRWSRQDTGELVIPPDFVP